MKKNTTMFFKLFDRTFLLPFVALAIISSFMGAIVLYTDSLNERHSYQASMIWMHGLGADSSDMMGLVHEMNLDGLHINHVFLNAPVRSVTLNAGMRMPAWYDIYGLGLLDREDIEGIQHSESIIRDAMETQIQRGVPMDHIFLAGFSQGGAMALYTGLRTPAALGGIVALSAYLPAARHLQPVLPASTPIFMGGGSFDPLVLPIWTKQSTDWLSQKGYPKVLFKQYPMEHSVCKEELDDLAHWLREQIQGVHA